MKPYIAEKPSLDRGIVNVLATLHRKAVGCIYAADGDCISCGVGAALIAIVKGTWLVVDWKQKGVYSSYTPDPQSSPIFFSCRE